MRYLLNALLILAAIGCFMFASDYLSWRFRIPNRDPHGSVEVQRSYAVKLKNQKTGYMFDAPESQECVNALFPHGGEPPCWYARRHTRQEIDLDPARKDGFWKAP